MYIHERDDWPDFRWDDASLVGPLAAVRHRQGRLLGRMEMLGFDARADASFRILADDVLKTSAIEGEILDPEQVRSSLARRLGLDVGGLPPADRHVDGVVEMTLDASRNFAASLTAARLFGWHAALFPTDWSGLHPIRVGAWRDDSEGPMQVVSGPIGRERVHYEAPAASRLPGEMRAFLDWFEGEGPVDPILKAGLAHLWFVTIHPFADGNGRIARAVADLALARGDGLAERCYGMSAQIQAERVDYYAILERTQKGALDVTAWMGWFLGCLDRAFDRSEATLAGVLRRARFWAAHAQGQFNERQRKVLTRLLDGFEGKLTTSKWARLAKCSQDTAHRDVLDLVGRGVLVKDAAGGRSTSYSLVEPPTPGSS